MKIKHAILLLVLGYCCDFVGTTFKILHAAYGDMLFVLGTVLKVLGLLLLVFKLFTHPEAKEFLNW
ncbi:MAG TPA: hypothetical protein VHW43_03015 [Puia sp.]|nr:hypothetical protein [Puia sp.]